MVDASAVVKVDNRIIPLTESIDVLASRPDSIILIDFSDSEPKREKQRPPFASPQSKPFSQSLQADSQTLRVSFLELLSSSCSSSLSFRKRCSANRQAVRQRFRALFETFKSISPFSFISSKNTTLTTTPFFSMAVASYPRWPPCRGAPCKMGITFLCYSSRPSSARCLNTAMFLSRWGSTP